MLHHNYYTLANALSGRMSLGHRVASNNPDGRLGQRAFHTIMDHLERFPVAGEIIALFELGVVTLFDLSHENSGNKFLNSNGNINPLVKKNEPATVVASKIWPHNWTRTQRILGLAGAVSLVMLTYHYLSTVAQSAALKSEKILTAPKNVSVCMENALIRWMVYNGDCQALTDNCREIIKNYFSKESELNAACHEAGKEVCKLFAKGKTCYAIDTYCAKIAEVLTK